MRPDAHAAPKSTYKLDGQVVRLSGRRPKNNKICTISM